MSRFAVAAAALLVLAAGSAAADEPGSQVFLDHCKFCHLQMGTGTLMLAHRLGKEHALLADRTDLDPDYIGHVVRNGIGSMPALTRVEVPDADLDRIAAYLTRNNPKK